MNDQTSETSLPPVELIPPSFPAFAFADGETTGEPAETTASSDNSLGGLLQQARAAQRLTRADIAAVLRLQVRVITALEENNFSSLPVAVFVRGYLRGYAKLVNVPPEPLIAAYERQSATLPTAPPLVVTQATARQPNQSSGDWLWRSFTYIVVFGLIGLVGLWWQNRDEPAKIPAPSISATTSGSTNSPDDASKPGAGAQSQEPPEVLATTPPSEDAATPATYAPAAGAQGTATTPPAVPSSPVSPSTAVGMPTPTSNTQATANGSGASMSAHTQPTPETGAVNTAAPSHPPVATATTSVGATLAATAAATPSPAPPSPTNGQPTVTIQTTAETWVKIKDSAGQVLFDEPLEANQSRSFQGQPPFRVHLKRAAGVTITYNGQPFDFSSHVHGKSARFAVGRAGHAH